MDQKSFLIKRPDENGHSVCDQYLTVTAAPKDGFFTRIRPSYWKRHTLLLAKIESMIKEGLEDDRNRRLRRTAQLPEQSRLIVKHKLDSEANTDATRTEVVINQIRGYRISSLEVLVDAGKQRLASLARTGGVDGESWVRELSSYSGIITSSGIFNRDRHAFESSLNDVRQSFQHFALEDLSSLTGKDRANAELIMKLSDVLRCHAFEVEEGGEDNWKHYGNREEVIARDRYVSSDLACLAVERPEIIDRITDYMTDYPMPYTSAEVGHLREWIEAPAHALTAGVL